MSDFDQQKTHASPQKNQQISAGGDTAIAPPAFQLKASNPVQMAPDDQTCEQPSAEDLVCAPDSMEAYAEFLSTAEANEETAKKLYELGDDMGAVIAELMRQGKYSVISALWGYVYEWDKDWVTRTVMNNVSYQDLLNAPNEFLQTMYDSLDSGWTTDEEYAFMASLTQVMKEKSLLPPEEEVCETPETEAPVEDKFDRETDLKEASEYESTAGAKTLYGKRQHSNLGTLKKKENTKGTISYSYSGKKMADEDAYYEAVDAMYEGRAGDKEDKVTDDQKDLLEIARKAATDASYFNDVINSSESAKTAEIDYSNAQLENDAYTFSSVLKHRMAQYHKFMVAVGLYTSKVIKPGKQSALRDRGAAHKWSTEHYITQNKNKETMLTNFKTMYDDDSYHTGDFIHDKDDNNWAKKSHFVDKDDKQIDAEGAGDWDKEKTWTKIHAYVDTFNYRGNKSSLASEGYNSTDKKRYPNASSISVSNHIYGNALDIPSGAFTKRNDAINDFVAWEFGVQRDAGNEQWHFECTGRPIRNEEKNDDETVN